MLSRASRLALPGFLLSLTFAAPAMAQDRDPAEADPSACYRTIGQRTGAVAEPPAGADARCSAPRETRVHGGWAAHAVMLVGDSARRLTQRPRPAAAWRDAAPEFAVPPALR